MSPSNTAGPDHSTGSDVLVDFSRTGGFAGFVDHLVVWQDGWFTVTRAKPAVSRSGRLTAAELADLRQQLTAADLAHLPRVQASAKGNDLFVYQLKTHDSQVIAQDGAIAPALRPVLSTLSGLVTKYGS